MRPISDQLRSTLRDELNSTSEKAVARRAAVHPNTLRRAIEGYDIRDDTAVRLEKFAPRVRRAEEFVGKAAVTAPMRQRAYTDWDLERIRAARNEQLRGQFCLPVQLARVMRTDDAIFTARRNRLAPQSAIATELRCHTSTRAKQLRAKALNSVFMPKSVLKSIHGTLVDHGIAVGYIEHEPNEAGTRIDFRLTEWPLEHVRWDATRSALTTRTESGELVDIVHGDSRWAVFKTMATEPWANEACLLAAAFIYPAHTGGIGDWAASSNAHGLAKIVGELPEGTSLVNEEGVPTNEAQEFLNLLQGMISGDTPAGIRPAGAKTDFLANGSTAWQVWSEFANNREKAAARVYQGTDAYLGSTGGAPGVDIEQLFRVAATLIQGDFLVLEAGIDTGVLQPWAAVNEGDSRLAPSFNYKMPDSDEQKIREQTALAWEKFNKTISDLRSAGFDVDQELANRIASNVGLSPAPKVASRKVSTVELAPTDIAKVVRASEARDSQGLPPFGDARDDMTMTELDQWNEAKAAATADTP